MNTSAQYCASRAAVDGSEDISEVKILQGITTVYTNTSGCGLAAPGIGSVLGKYSNFRSQTINLQKGVMYTLVVKFEQCNLPFLAGLKHSTNMWIDLNKDFLLDSANERLCRMDTQNLFTATTILIFSKNFLIPTTTSVDTSIMRITSYTTNGSNTNKACDTIFGGETEDYTVTFCSPLPRSIVKQNPRCAGDSTGSMRVAVTGSPLKLTYSWQGGAFGSSDSLVGMPAGSYTVVTKDSTGCQYVDTIVLSQPAPLTMTKQVDSSCARSVSGKITVSGLGATPSYQYRLGTGSWGSQRVWSSLAAGTYIVSLRDSFLCTRSDTIRVDSVPRIPYTFR